MGLHGLDEVLMFKGEDFLLLVAILNGSTDWGWETFSPRKLLPLHQDHANPFSPLQNILLNTPDIVLGGWGYQPSSLQLSGGYPHPPRTISITP